MIFTFIHFIIRLNVMSLKYSSTTADYLQWSEAMNLIRKLAKDGNYKISLLVALGCFTGLRISDIGCGGIYRYRNQDGKAKDCEN